MHQKQKHHRDGKRKTDHAGPTSVSSASTNLKSNDGPRHRLAPENGASSTRTWATVFTTLRHPQAEQWSCIHGDTTPVVVANSVANRVIDQPLDKTGCDHS